MTVPSGQTSSSAGKGDQRPARRSVPWFRRRRVLWGGVGGLGLAVTLLVGFAPGLAAPIGTAAAVVAVVLPLVQKGT